MKVNRKELLQRLLMVKPGISARETIHQSSCVVMKRGRFYTLSQEIACSLESGLPVEIEGAIRAQELISFLSLWSKEEIELEVSSKTLSLRGSRTKIPMEAEVLLPVDNVEKPKDWSKLDPNFAEAVRVVSGVVSKKTRVEDGFLSICVHVTDSFIEASDNNRYARYTIPTFLQSPSLVRGESIREIVQLGMTKGCETENWLHFRNPMGLRMSIRKWMLEKAYPDWSEFLDQRGDKIIFPKDLEDITKRCGIFEDEKGIKVSLEDQKMTIEGMSSNGRSEESRMVKYSGKPTKFIISHKLLEELVKEHTECEITKHALRANGNGYVFLSSLEFRE
jgi:hypothetical protein